MCDKICAYTVSEEIWMVPCIIRKHEFEPLSKPFDLSLNLHALQTRQTWQSVEDEVLKDIVVSRGTKGWSTVAQELNKKVHKGIPVRQGKQCRERYFNHLDPNLKKDKWSTEEDLVLMENQQRIGNKWSEIKKLLPGRTENQIKNRYKGLLKRGRKGCSKGADPIAHLLCAMKGSEAKTSSVENTPGTYDSVSQADLSFSCLAERVSSFLVPDSPLREDDASPTAMLFFHSE